MNKVDPLTTTQEVTKELSVAYIWHLKPIGKVGKLDKWMPYELAEIILGLLQIIILSYNLWHAMKSELSTTTSTDQLSDG